MTPMMKQFREIKKKYRDAILFFRVGDFYEMFGEDAKEASKILNIALTARHKGTPNEIEMCGIPHHSALSYISKLIKANKKVAICDQISDPSLPGIVKREVRQVITPGTTLDQALLDDKRNNYLFSIIYHNNKWGCSFVDLSTGDFRLCLIKDKEQLFNLLFKLMPSEIIIPQQLKDSFIFEEKGFNFHLTIFDIPVWLTAEEVILEQFPAKDLSGFGIEKMQEALQAASNLLVYLKETQKTALDHIKRISLYNPHDFMLLDESTIRNLELIFNTQDNSRNNTLLAVIDKTNTAMGARLLRYWILHPLLDKEKIEERHTAVEELLNHKAKIRELSKIMSELSDIERLLARIGCGRANPRDFIFLYNSLRKLPFIKGLLKDCKSALLNRISKNLDTHDNICNMIFNAIKEDAPVNLNNGGYIKDGYNKELDFLRNITVTGRDWLENYQKEQIERTNISSLKIGYNKIFGYYIEVSKTNLDKVPSTYIRKQTLTNAERFITTELKEYEERVLGAHEKIIQLERELFEDLILKIKSFITSMQRTSLLVAQLDVLLSFAIQALDHNYSKPCLLDDSILYIKNGRHPVIEIINSTDSYIPNDLFLDTKQRLIILTGPNMAGKSSYLRQNALIVLMAQIGSFVPAEQVKMGIVDRIFTRVGASDNLAMGRSTFLVEMQEAANIIHNATQRSLIIFDELGRGTSTYDGISIAWAVIEYVYEVIKAKTLFATHYHELVELESSLSGVKNYSVAVKENNDGIIFLRKVIPGGSSRSYGVEVAKLAGLPNSLIQRARDILNQLESKKNIKPDFIDSQMALFPNNIKKQDPILEELKQIDINNITPLEGLQIIKNLQNKLKEQE